MAFSSPSTSVAPNRTAQISLTLSMAHLYSTKALGKTWLPPSSPSRTVSRGRYGTWPPSSSLKHQAVQDSPSLRIWRGRPAERIAVLLGLALCITTLLYYSASLPLVFNTLGSRVRNGGSLIPLWHRTDWHGYAYTTYATTLDDLCNSVMLAESLHRLHAKPDVLILYASHLTNNTPSAARILSAAAALYNAKPTPVDVISASADSAPDPTWSASFTKLLAFNQTEYKRVLSLDADATLLQPLDDLFLLPPAPVAMPPAYWLPLNESKLSSSVMLATPSAENFALIRARIAARGREDYDMEIVNSLFRNTSLVVPHRPYLLITGEFRKQDHNVQGGYLHPTHPASSSSKSKGEEQESWSARAILQEARYIHFSDHPLPKPWRTVSKEMQKGIMPACRPRPSSKSDGVDAAFDKGGQQEHMDCEDREVWLGLYEDHRARRRRVCGGEFVGWEAMGGGGEGERWGDGGAGDMPGR